MPREKPFNFMGIYGNGELKFAVYADFRTTYINLERGFNLGDGIFRGPKLRGMTIKYQGKKGHF